jgi:GT2 family glycosyltransferase
LSRSTHPSLKVIVVDHGTTKATAHALAARQPGVIRVAGNSDLWWTGATNLGIRAARERGARLIMLLNNDCYVTPNTIARLVAHSSETTTGIIAPLQRAQRDGHLLTNRATTCFALGFPTVPLPVTGLPIGEHRLVHTRLIVGGRGVVIPSALFDRVGLFDEARLPHYGADHDFFLRCRRLGVPLYLALDAFVDMDDTRTTVATNPGGMTVRQFFTTLSDRRSHRNIRVLSNLFRLHYPIPGLHRLGVALNILRYTLVYFARRVVFLVRHAM